ncbi:ribulokinase [Alienimonas californiensis]|uniref:Ribulokinase n=1 Tax=Alienimonas californiensis TaxID=2527989 RepID=A0A517P6L3_9PLAN|nr:ribulokinase [Alienimonas californiensis]QDT15021.1 Ribulokinase [Alienimonas californiensis]
MTAVALGLDFGTESVRALLADAAGTERGTAEAAYEHGQILRSLPGSDRPLPPRFALQCPRDWLDAAAVAVRAALAEAGLDPREVVGVGVDFTSCTMLPTTADGTPLCELPRFADQPHAWPKLWKHHGAVEQTARMNRIATERDEPFLKRYGGIIGLEWLQPKMLEAIEDAPEVAAAADVWLEGGDWFVWQLVGGPAEELPRSTCQAGYKALWSATEGYPSDAYFAAVHPGLAEAVRTKLPGRKLAPGQVAGRLTEQRAAALGLPAGIAVSAAVIDAHAAVPGVGAAGPGALVMVMGTSSCHMLNATEERFVPGLAGVVEGGILPDLFGYETGQAAVGDAFDWLRTLLGQDSFEAMAAAAAELPPGAEGVRCLDWFNGCRTPLMDGALRGTFSGLSLHAGPGHLYRALSEASACGLRWIVELLREGGVPIDRLIAAGGLPHHNRALVQVYADVLGEPIDVHPARQAPALGAAILGMVAAGRFDTVAATIEAMAAPVPAEARVEPDPHAAALYQSVYADYRRLAETFAPTAARQTS